MGQIDDEAENLGFQQGFERGMKEGRAAAEQELATLRQSMQQSVQDLASAGARLSDEQVAGLANVAHGICRKVVERELSTRPEIFVDFMQRAVAQLDTGTVTVHVNPDDETWLSQALTQGQTQGQTQGMQVIADPEIPLGACSVRTPECTADFDPMAVINELFAAATASDVSTIPGSEEVEQ